MTRQRKKRDKRLKARLDDWNSIGNKENLSGLGLKMNKPGSQNRKK